MTRYRGTNPDYDEPMEEGDAYPYVAPTDPQPTGAETGSQTLTIGAGPVARPATAQQICRWLAHEKFPSPLVAIVDVRGTTGATSANPFAQQVAALAQNAGAQNGSLAELGGVLRLTYGHGAAQRVAEGDLRSGSYQIPPCTSCLIEAFLYLTGPATVTVSASLVPGALESPSRLLNTFRATLAAGGTVTAKVPLGARWVSLSGGGATGIATGQPVISLRQASGPLIYQDFATGVFHGTSGQLVELGGRDDVIVTNHGASPVTVTARFALEM